MMYTSNMSLSFCSRPSTCPCFPGHQNTTIAGSSQALKLTLKNLGITPINSVDVTWTDGTNEYTDNLTGLNLNSLESHPLHTQEVAGQQGLQM